MKDERDNRLDRLFAAARQDRRDTSRVEYGFETRLLARLRAAKQSEVPFFAWAWRLTPLFAAVVIGLGAWSWSQQRTSAVDLQTAVVGGSDESLYVMLVPLE